MSITQKSKTQARTGNFADLPVLKPGELGYATDQQRLFIGNVGGLTPGDNTEIASAVIGGLPTEVQYNNSGALGGIPTATYSGGVLSLGSTTDISISGGSSGQVLSTDGSGGLSWTTTVSSPGGCNTQLQYNNSGSFAGVPTVTYNGSLLNLGSTSDISISGGSSGQALITNGSGTLSWASVAGSPGGCNTQIQYNNGGSFNGISTLTYNGSLVSLGSPSDITISGGSTGQVLTTDGSGALSWTTISGTSNRLEQLTPSSSFISLYPGDTGKHYYVNTASGYIQSYFIENSLFNSSTIGTVITFVQMGLGTTNIVPDTLVNLYMAGNSVAGQKSIGPYGFATLLQVEAYTWIITGTGVS